MTDMREARQRLAAARRIAVLTGSGVSAASGIPTFRGPGGLWRQYRVEELATPEAYRRDPELVWEWYRTRFELVRASEPNRAHELLAQLEETAPDVTIVTQNVDGLHQRSGSRRVIELHGNLTQSRCETCGQVEPLAPGFLIPPRCSACGGRARPNVVWFGELLPDEAFTEAVRAFQACELALVVGTSAAVEPAASLGRLAAQQGALVIEINPQTTPLTPHADLSLRLSAASGLTELLAG